jgi:hypothetical protein
LLDVSEGNTGSGLAVYEPSESGLSLNEAEWDLVLSAEGWEEGHDFDWVDIMGNDNKSGLLLFNEGGDVVQTELEVLWLWTGVGFLGLGFSLESGLLLGSSFWGVVTEELEES